MSPHLHLSRSFRHCPVWKNDWRPRTEGIPSPQQQSDAAPKGGGGQEGQLLSAFSVDPRDGPGA